MPGKAARALCPVCQEPMPPDETECDNCGAFVIDEAVVRLSRAFGIPREKALALFEKGYRHPKQLKDRNVDDVLERGENGLLFLCTNCGGFVATGDTKCQRCGAEFEPEPEPKPERDILDLILCPVCGADNDPELEECEICGEPFGEDEEETADRPSTPIAAVPEEPKAASSTPTEASPATDSLERIDDILDDLDKPARETAAPAVRRRQKVPKVAKRTMAKKATPRMEAAATAPVRPVPSGAAVKPIPKKTLRSAPPPAESPPHRPPDPAASEKRSVIAARTATTARERRRSIPPPRSRVWTSPTSEFTGGMTVATALILILSPYFWQPGVAVAIIVTLLALTAYVLPPVLLRRRQAVRPTDALLLAAGAALGAIAPAVPGDLAAIVAVAAAIPLALATRHLLRTSARDLLAVASGIALLGPAAAVALGSSYAYGLAWVLGLVAAVPWSAAVSGMGFRIRHISAVRHRELTKAERDLLRQDYVESVKDFDRAIAVGGQDAPGAELPWYGKGASLILLGRYEEAVRAIDTALDLNPRNEVAWLNKGNALTKMGRLLDALRCFNAAIKVNPRYEVAWNNKGNTLARLGHNEEALACYEQALGIDPEYRGAWVNKGYVLTKLGRYDEATACADRALQLSGRPRTAAA